MIIAIIANQLKIVYYKNYKEVSYEPLLIYLINHLYGPRKKSLIKSDFLWVALYNYYEYF